MISQAGSHSGGSGRARAGVVVIGGGAVGASVAYHLATLGAPSVVLLERDTLASGSSGKSAGGVRLQFSDALNLRIALRSVEAFERFDEVHGTSIEFRQYGYLFLVDAPDITKFRAALALQHAHGISSEEIGLADAAEIVPGLSPEGLRAAFYCARDGYATPEAVVQGYARSAARAGVEIRQSVAVDKIVVRGGRVIGVEAGGERISTNAVVCAAGVWSRALASGIGVDLPVTPEKRWLHYGHMRSPLPQQCPLTIDFSTGFYFHREGAGFVFGGRAQALEDVVSTGVHRLPALADADVRSSWWGYYEMSPDRNAMVGEAEDPSGFYYATGFSGHGFQQAPAVGEYLAHRILGLTPTLDLSPLSAARFSRDESVPEAVVV